MSKKANEIRDEIFFIGGKNTDDDPRFLSDGDYLDALNIDKFYNGSKGIAVNAKGNSEEENSFLPAGTNKCIGACKDEENNALMFFNYNSNNNHGVYRFLKDSSTFQKILHNESVLGFVSDCENLQAKIIGGLLYWNEGKDSSGNFINNPRKINIERARRHTNGLGGDAYTNITADVMSVIKPPYLGYLNASFSFDDAYSYSSKFIDKVYYKFAIQLIYDDNEVSVLGNYSNLVENIDDEDNYVAIRFKYDSIDDTVKYIKIYAIRNFTEAPVLIKKVNLDDLDNMHDENDDSSVSSLTSGNYYVYRFYGDAVGSVYNNNIEISDSVPVFANSMTIEDNRLMYGDVSFLKNLGTISDGGNVYIPLTRDFQVYDSTAFTSSTDDTATTYRIDVENILPAVTDFIDINSTHFMSIIWKGSAVISGSSNGYVSVHLKIDCRKIAPYWSYDKIVDYIISKSEIYVLDGSSNRTDGVLSNPSSDPNFTLRGTITDDGNIGALSVVTNIMRVDKANNLAYKSHSNRLFATVYLDKYGRSLGYQFGDSDNYITLDRGAGLTFGTTTPLSDITFFFNCGVPIPIGSNDIHYISVVASENLDFTDCWQYKNSTYDPIDQTFTYPETYIFLEGDFLRLIGEEKLWKILSIDEDFLYLPEDFEIPDGHVGTDIEILRLNLSEGVVFNEIRTWDVSGGNPTQDNAFGYYLSDGEVWLDIDEDENHVYESFSDDNGKYISVIGRPFSERVEFNIDEYQNIHFSGKYFDNTEINGLSTFESEDRVELSDEKGDIIDLAKIGEVLYAYQRREITSFYLGKEILKQASTGEITADSSQVLGGKRESAFDFGTVFKTSKMDNSTYGYDIYKGVFWMNSYNGVKTISGKDESMNYKMDAYFKNKSKVLLDSGISNINVIVGVDKPNDIIYVTFIDSVTSANNETVGYHRPSNRWIGRYSFVPEQYSWLDDQMYSFKSGKLYKHNDSSALRCNYYDVQYTSLMRFASNKVMNEIKVYNAIGVHSDGEWKIDNDDAILIPKNDTYPEMSSSIPYGKWRPEEGIYRSDFLRNAKSTSSVIKLIDLRIGELLRGYVVIIEMINNSTDEVRLFKVDIDSELSK